VPPRRKKVTPQTLAGEGGVAIIARRVNEMGYLWHDRRVDQQIDGEIELVSPDGIPLNIVVMVQSKARGRRFAYETDDSFQWTADPADLDYWLSGNAPVIVVLSRPAEDLAWWFDVRAEFADPRRRAERTVTISKHQQSFDKSAAAAIMHTAVPRGSGIYLASPPKKEILTTNLLPVQAWPAALHLAPAAIRDYAEGWRRVGQAPGHATGWILGGGMIASFGDLGSPPLKELCDGSAERHDTAEWAGSDDQDTLNQFSDLLRRTLVSDRSRDIQWHQSRRHLHFRATRDLRPRVEGRGQGRRGRTVFGPHYARDDPGQGDLLPSRRAHPPVPAHRRRVVLRARRGLLLHPGREERVLLRRHPPGWHQAPGPPPRSTGLDPDVGDLSSGRPADRRLTAHLRQPADLSRGPRHRRGLVGTRARRHCRR